MRFTVDRIDHIVLNVKDVETAAAWYERVLGMKRVVTEPRPGAKVTSSGGKGPAGSIGRPSPPTTRSWKLP